MRRRLEAAAEACQGHREEVDFRDVLRLEGASFGYEGGRRPTIRDLDLTVEAGGTVALVGPSGAGKSTVADLVSGLLAPTGGRVLLLDERPLAGGTRSSWRDRIGYVAQETFLFNDTVTPCARTFCGPNQGRMMKRSTRRSTWPPPASSSRGCRTGSERRSGTGAFGSPAASANAWPVPSYAAPHS